MIVNKKCIARLSSYRKTLLRFQELGFIKIFSDTLGDAVGVTSAQVRKDFSLFGISGNKRGGYQIEQLLERLQEILWKDIVQKVVVVGVGNIGSALIQYKSFENEGIDIVAGFDIDPAKVSQKSKVPIYPLDELKSYVKKHNIRIGIVAVPEMAAQEVFREMVEAGIKGFLNFAPIRYKLGEEVIINNVNLQIELENVIYFVNALNKKHKG